MALSPRKPLSRPVVVKTLTISTLQGTKVIDRVLHRTIRALFSTSVILRITATEDEIAKMRAVISEKIGECSKYFSKQADIFAKLMETNGVTQTSINVSYTHPREVRISVTSPPAMAFVTLLNRLDELAQMIDLLWWSGVFDDRQRLRALHQLQGHLIKLGQHFVNMERRAREAADRKGKTSDVMAAVGEETAPIADLPEAEHVETGDEAVTEIVEPDALLHLMDTTTPVVEDDLVSAPSPPSRRRSTAAAAE